MIASEEKERLQDIAKYFSMKDGFNGYMNKYRVSKILEMCVGDTVIDIGSADAFMAEALAPFFRRIVAVDGSLELVERARNRLSGIHNVEMIHALAEEFVTEEKFDLVLLSFILEHVVDPPKVINASASFIAPGGAMFVMVPNALSLHRRIGVALGMMAAVDDFSDEDRRQGHRRVYTEELLRSHLEEGGVDVLDIGSFFIKPLSNPQMEKLDPNIADAFFTVSRDIPGLGSMLYAKCTPKK